MSFVVLGNVEFEGFEVPAKISFGGDQKLAIHKLIGGARVIDSLGRDDAALSWSGVLSGSAAAQRSRSLDAMRAEGLLQTLTWDAFSYIVVVSKLKLEFCSPWWIPYHISCAVQRDLAQTAITSLSSASSSITDDLATAIALLAPQNAGLSVDLSTAPVVTAAAQQQLKVGLAATKVAVDNNIETAGSVLSSVNIGDLVTSAGALAQLCCARGFIERSLINLDGITF